jgi:hypothetical protein
MHLAQPPATRLRLRLRQTNATIGTNTPNHKFRVGKARRSVAAKEQRAAAIATRNGRDSHQPTFDLRTS